MLTNKLIMDSSLDEAKDFLVGLEKSTGRKWSCKVYNNNQKYGFARYAKFFVVGFKTFLGRHSLERLIFWQQFYGLTFAMFCRLFKVKKVNQVTVMTFIFNQTPGKLGEIKKKFVKYCVESVYIDKIICTSHAEVEKYATIFEISTEKFAFVRWGAVDYSNRVVESNRIPKGVRSHCYLFSTGRSNRDYSFLIKSLMNQDFDLLIATDQLSEGSRGDNIYVSNHLFGEEMLNVMANAWCVVIALNDSTVAAGQLVLLHAMNLGVPVILTKSEGVTDDYVINGKTGLIIGKTQTELLEALNELRANQALYENLKNNSRRYFFENFTKETLGQNIGKVVSSLEKGV